MTVKIQLAVQGGGAKIVALMAALEALEEVQDKVQVTRIVGSSAGAVAGVFFASGVGINAIADGWRNGAVEHLLNELTVPTSRWRPKWTFARHFMKAKPLWKEDAIHAYLQSVLDMHTSKPRTFAQLNAIRNIKVSVMSTNLADRRSVESLQDDPIVPRLLDSIGLPYLLRKWGSGNSPVIVDGGIGDNLPALKLNLAHADEIPVCLSFKPTYDANAKPTSFTQFSLALLDTAIDVSTTQSASLVPNSYFIDTSITTFDFRHALAVLNSREYDAIKATAKAWFVDLYQKISTLEQQRAKAYSVTELHPWQSENKVAQAVMMGLWDGIYRQYKEERFRFHRVEFRVTIGALGAQRIPDFLRYTLEFEPGEKPLYCYWMGVTDGVEGQLVEEPKISVIDLATGEAVPHVRVPAIRSDDPSCRTMVLFFTPPLTKGRYRVTQVEKGYELMPRLVSGSIDELGVSPDRVDGAIGQVDLIVDMPDVVQRYRINPRANNRAATTVQIEPEKAPGAGFSDVPGYQTTVVRGSEVVGTFALDISVSK